MMKTSIGVLAFAVIAISTGCSGKQPDNEAPASNPQGSETKSEAKSSANLGTEQDASHFTVRLSSLPIEPKAGKVKFLAEIKHHGSPTQKAEVVLHLKMTSMDMGVEVLNMTPTGVDRYEVEGDLRMSGEWEARLEISEEGHKGSAVYRISVKE